MVAEEVIITLSGGAPWGFRLQGGVEHQKPLQVAKVRQVHYHLIHRAIAIVMNLTVNIHYRVCVLGKGFS